jgi:hypothetical protein
MCGLDFVEANYISIFTISKKFLVRCVLLAHFTYIFINLKLQYNLNVELFKLPDVFGNTTNLLEMLLPLLCHFVLVSESFYKRRKHEKIVILMRKIHLKLNCNLHAKSTNLPLVKFLFLFAINSLIFIAVFIMVRGTPGMYAFVHRNFKLDCMSEKPIKFADKIPIKTFHLEHLMQFCLQFYPIKISHSP